MSGDLETSNKTGQALLELAVFGTFLIMLLGILLNYGLNYYYQQDAMMEAHRRALADGDKGVTYMYFKDKHIPDPSNPFAMGGLVPISASASVTRDHELDIGPNPGIRHTLPSMRIDTGKGGIREFKVAGFRKEGNVKISSIPKYQQVYPVVVCPEGKKGRICNADDQEEQGWMGDSTCKKYATTGTCTENGNSCTSDHSNCTCVKECLEWDSDCPSGDKDVCYYKDVKVMDSCEGEIISYDACRKQCMIIVDNRACSYDISNLSFVKVSDCACEVDCEAKKPAGSDKDCNATCNKQMEIPWYCKPPNPNPQGYTFALDSLFSATYRKTMGIQPGDNRSTTTTTTLNKQEGQYIDAKYNFPDAITTTDTVDWDESIKRRFIYHGNHLDNEGYSSGTINDITGIEMDGGKHEVRTTKWITPW